MFDINQPYSCELKIAESSMTAPILRPEPTPQQEPKLPDQIADAWAAVLIDIYQRLKR